MPTEAPRPTIAELPSPDIMPRQAVTPESRPSTEPLQPLASAEAPLPGASPLRPPDPEPLPVEAPEPEPPEEAEVDAEAVAETEPEGELALAPQEAAIPVARPADLAAAAPASRETEAPAPEETAETETAEPETPPEPAAAETAETETAPETQPARPQGSPSRFAAQITQGEKAGLRAGIQQYFTYAGNRTDPALAVKIEIVMEPSGRIAGGPTLIEARGGTGPVRESLFQAGRRALIRAALAGEFRKLPAEKFDAWRIIHVTFTPDDLGFQS